MLSMRVLEAQKMCMSRIFITILIALQAVLSAQDGVASDIPTNLIPMYGGSGVVKSEEQKKGDEKFIESVTKSSGTRQLASKQFAGEGWRLHQRGDMGNAMRRFNQAWLLDPESFLPYWGFGAILFKAGKPEEAIWHYDRSLSLIDMPTERSRLLNDSARAHAFAASRSGSDAGALRTKAEALFRQAVEIDPKYLNAYADWIAFNIIHQEYSKAWKIVSKAREEGIQNLPPELIKVLTEKMPEPK